MGNRLKEIRKQKGLTQEELGKLINVTKVSICCYENETRMPSLDTLEDLTKVFGVDTNYFFGKDVPAVMEGTKDYVVYLAKEDLELISELKQNKELYNMLISEPKRMVELIDKKLK
jgi:transcriptional regulator with XRE-family HTH domain